MNYEVIGLDKPDLFIDSIIGDGYLSMKNPTGTG